METLVAVYEGIQWVFVFIDFVVIGALLFLMPLAMTYRPDLFPRRPNARVTTLSRSVLREQWDMIKSRFAEGTPASVKLAVIEADKFVDHILKESGFQGEHMADRMEKLSSHGLQTFERLWRAHKIRNEIVHSLNYEISSSEASQAMEDYEAFLRELRVLY